MVGTPKWNMASLARNLCTDDLNTSRPSLCLISTIYLEKEFHYKSMFSVFYRSKWLIEKNKRFDTCIQSCKYCPLYVMQQRIIEDGNWLKNFTNKCKSFSFKSKLNLKDVEKAKNCLNSTLNRESSLSLSTEVPTSPLSCLNI